jgi:hypothetical protein
MYGLKPVPFRGAERVCVRTSETQTFEREPGRTADPSAALFRPSIITAKECGFSR